MYCKRNFIKTNIKYKFTSDGSGTVLPNAVLTVCWGLRAYAGGGASWLVGWSVAGCCVAPTPP